MHYNIYVKKLSVIDSILIIYLSTFPLLSQFQPLIFYRVGIDNLLILFAFGFFLLMRFINLNNFTIHWIFFYSFLAIFGTVGLLRGIESNSSWQDPIIFFQIAVLLILIYSRKNNVIYFVKAFLFGASIAAIFGLLQFFSEYAWYITDRFYLRDEIYLTESLIYSQRMASVSLFPPNGNFFGSYMLFSLLVLLAIKRRLDYRIFWVLTTIFTVGLFLSLSWTSIGSLFLAWTFIMIYKTIIAMRYLKLPIQIVIYIGITIIICFVFILIFQSNAWEGFTSKFYRYFLVIDPNTGFPRGLSSRIYLWKENLNQMNTLFDYLFGIGFGNIVLVDNYLLHIIIATGMIGTILLSIFILKTLFISFKVVKHYPYPLMGLIVFIVLNTTAAYALYTPVAVGVLLLFLLKNKPPTIYKKLPLNDIFIKHNYSLGRTSEVSSSSR